MIINEQALVIGAILLVILSFTVAILCYRKIAQLKDINLSVSEKIQELEKSEVQLEHNLNRYKEQYLVSKTRLEAKFDENEALNSNVRVLENKLEMVSNDLYEHKSRIAQHQEKVKSYTDKINLLEKSEIRLTQQFENIANKIFSEKTASFTQQNKTGLDGLLTPLKEQLSSFSKQVNDVYTTEAKERHALKSEILGLKELNVQMGLEANALTKALKGDNKKQGTWGEVVLERVLQSSGLREGHEYETQLHLKNQDGKAYKPDVVIHLPQGKDVVVDSKMVLVAYERFHNAQTEGEQSAALKSHIDAIKNHVKELSAKDYQMLHGITSLDYVLMFIPVEPAFNAALEYEPSLVQFALEKNIMLVSPNNLIVALRTINNMWRMEYQNRNAQDIADKAGSIYDKLVGFVDDMTKVGINLERAESSYDDAMKKLSEGRGNLVKKAEEMKSLNIKVKKSLPKEMIEKSEISFADPTEITSKLQ
ncbi:MULTISPECIES: DNA recombination protein RmuC [unclassified Pseudoalteromonas]|uniref:DNA recombination protein RmuC n=1 Tax=unclassified Pseudoalteromonas TaxID=194690 RepID=UPI0005A994BD|nr:MULTISPECIES: DNA recombination protein RmuC [unclassified Pseudoalteromonas]